MRLTVWSMGRGAGVNNGRAMLANIQLRMGSQMKKKNSAIEQAYGVAICHGGFRFFQSQADADDCLKTDPHAYFSFTVQHVGKHSPPLLRVAMAASGYGDALTRVAPGVA